MKWFFIATSIFFTIGAVGERDRERSRIYSVITVISLTLAFLTNWLA